MHRSRMCATCVPEKCERLAVGQTGLNEGMSGVTGDSCSGQLVSCRETMDCLTQREVFHSQVVFGLTVCGYMSNVNLGSLKLIY